MTFALKSNRENQIWIAQALTPDKKSNSPPNDIDPFTKEDKDKTSSPYQKIFDE